MVAESSGSLHFVHNAPPEDHDLKRQYLALLPPQQVIDICLMLDIHVPRALKRNIWPTDFRAVLASMQNLVPKVEEVPPTIPREGSSSVTPDTQRAEDQPPQPTSERKPPDKPPTAAAGPSTLPVPPLQPFGFATQSAYPHTPYYQAIPPGYAPFSYTAFPAPAGFPAAYPQPFAYPGATFFTTSQQPDPPPNSSEDTDLPSYEDMIVEGLTSVGDPEGMAPKDLFNWMAARYPVQSNFRPSASQALQKAYRRGRFEKSTGGRYRLNPNWEGGNSSTRRATRRPQTQSAATPISKPRVPAATPFTSAPRLLQPFIPVTVQPGSTPAKPTLAETAKQTPPVDVPTRKPAVPPNSAYQAAQKILQSINFGTVFQLEDAERTVSPVKAEAVTMSLAEHARAELQARLALLAAQLEEIADQEADADADDEMERKTVLNAASEVEDEAQTQIARLRSDVHEARAERDEALKALHATEVAASKHENELSRLHALTESLERDVVHWKEQAKNWQDHYTRVEQDRCGLSTELLTLSRSVLTESPPKHQPDTAPPSARKRGSSSSTRPPAYKSAVPPSPSESDSPLQNRSAQSNPRTPASKAANPSPVSGRVEQLDAAASVSAGKLSNAQQSRTSKTVGAKLQIQTAPLPPRQIFVRRVHAVVHVKEEDEEENLQDEEEEATSDEDDDYESPSDAEQGAHEESGDDELIMNPHQEVYGGMHPVLPTPQPTSRRKRVTGAPQQSDASPTKRRRVSDAARAKAPAKRK
ncbi:hypothetical protein GGX14DRAFT_621251 [Mycena pura]|uniref:Histone H1 n=1 Tax=Mycena pura TaxID=153505 RepID=A0AAD6VK26_9AGAR|nr:hypothetical protein GGX14DRAFT_621251 [Mycena pura]